MPACQDRSGKEITTETTARELADIAFPIIASSIGGLPATADDKDALASDNPRVYAVIQARDRIGNKIYFSQATAAEIEGKRIAEIFPDGHPVNVGRTAEFPVFQWNESRYGPIEIEWSEVVAENGFYNNTVPSQSKIRYKEKPAGTGWSIKPSPGTHRYKLRVRYSGNEINGRQEITAKNNSRIRGVHRVTVREGNDLPGWMTAYGRLPYIYGSTEEQTEGLVGADCADAITWALRKTGRGDFPYTYSQGFRSMGKKVFSGYINATGELLDRNKKKARDVDIRRGDLLVYKAPQQHVAVFYSDLRQDGDPIEVVHTYGEKGVVVESLYLSFGFLLRDMVNLTGVQNMRLDAIDVIRLGEK